MPDSLIARGVLASGLLTVLLLAPGATLRAAQPVAIIEESSAGADALQAFTYLDKGQKLELGASEHLVIGYLNSCMRETITGGVIEIGEARSTVTDGDVDREVVPCDGGVTDVTAEQAEQSGVIVFRDNDGDGDADTESAGAEQPAAGETAPAMTPIQIFSCTPVFSVPDGVEELRIIRMDDPTDSIALKVTGSTVDLAKENRPLAKGTRYVARAGNRATVFRIADDAAAEGGPIVSRLVRL